jgi:2-amino-4-hydroxy-6-hydroxymethyldihydropteridine diphosphokinase
MPLEPVPILLGLGANLGNPAEQLRRAAELLDSFIAEATYSSLHRTEPVGLAGQPDYLNAVVRATTMLEAHALLAAIADLELALDRRRDVRNAARTIDVDILDYRGTVHHDGDLTLPHPRLHERAFVLVPLAQIAPDWRHPVLGQTPAEMLRTAPASRVERWAPFPGAAR